MKYARVILIMLLILSGFTSNISNSDIIIFPYDVYSIFPDRPPVIDGVIDDNEWAHVDTFDIGHGYLRIQNDASYLYILIDIIDVIFEG